METENKVDKKLLFCYGAMFLLTGLLVFAVSFLGGKSYEAILRNTIVSFVIAGIDIFMLLDADSRGKEVFSYDNYYHKMRFIITYIVMIVLSVAFSFVPNQFWPYMALFVILGLFSNNEIGITTGTGFVIISVMLEENGAYGELFMYVLAGIAALALFRDLKENTAIAFPTAISLMIQALLLMAYNVLFQNRTLSFTLLILPVLNIMLNLIIILIFLNVFGVYVIRKSNDMYMDINDAEFPLLARLRESNKDEYMRAVHTAYLAERIGLGLDLNARAIKACSYYHRIGVLDNKNSWEEVKEVFEENNFPVEVMEYLHECIEPEKGKIKSTEYLAVNITETVIASIMYLIKKDKDAKIDYDQLIDKIFEKRVTEGEVLEYNVSFREYNEMKKILKKEKLYYDFLR